MGLNLYLWVFRDQLSEVSLDSLKINDNYKNSSKYPQLPEIKDKLNVTPESPQEVTLLFV